MAEARADQLNFTGGQLDPRAASRADWDRYYTSAANLQNCIVIPQGGFQTRFGTSYVDTCTIATMPQYAEISTFVYNDSGTYLLLWQAATINIYLENINVVSGAAIATTFAAEDIPFLKFAQSENRVIVANENFVPKQLQLLPNASANVITGYTGAPSNYLATTTQVTIGTVYPVTFANDQVPPTPPTTSPQIYVGRTYYVKGVAGSNVQVFSTSEDAANGENAYVISSAGVGVSSLTLINHWTFTDIPIKQYPAFDFTGGYTGTGFTFTPSATSGAVTITASGAIFTAAHVNGLFTGNGGIVRITGYTDTTHVTGYTIQDFPNTNAIMGVICFLGEPAWSAARGYPRAVSLFQNRLVFGGSPSLPNGVWLSVINDLFNFDDSEALADNAISWYPSSGEVGYIRSMTSTKALIIHTNTGNYATPVLTEVALTPTNFVLTEHNKFGVSGIQPVFLDNQILFVDISGNNVISMIWDIGQSAYITDNKSIAASNLIKFPTDMIGFSQPQFADGFFSFFVNEDGTMAVLQTLIEQGISAFTPMNTSQYQWQGGTPDNYATIPGQFYRVTAARNRCWFTVQRTLPIGGTPTVITAISTVANTMTSASHGMTVGVATTVSFSTTGTLTVTNPQINTTGAWFARAIDANTFAVYTNANDAANDTNRIKMVSDTGQSSVWANQTYTYIEELNFSIYTDCSKTYEFAAPTTALTGLAYLNGLTVQIVADGSVLADQVVSAGALTLPNAASNVTVGLSYQATFQPLPVSIPQVAGVRYKKKHFRSLYIDYYNTVGATIQGYNIPVQTLGQNVILGQPVQPMTGLFTYTPMEGWDDITNEIQIVQSLPLPMTIRGISWVMEI